jgi:hypothetical protein
VVLEVGRLAARRLRDRLHVVRPPPTGLEDQPADLGIADLQDLGPSVGELPDLVGLAEAAVLGLLHGRPPCL